MAGALAKRSALTAAMNGLPCGRSDVLTLNASAVLQIQLERQTKMNKDELIKKAANRFLGWKFPVSMQPDGGLSLDRAYVERWKSMPTGTNLLCAKEAEEMFHHCLDDLLEEWNRRAGEPDHTGNGNENTLD